MRSALFVEPLLAVSMQQRLVASPGLSAPGSREQLRRTQGMGCLSSGLCYFQQAQNECQVFLFIFDCTIV